MLPLSQLDIDQILEAIRTEARARGAKGGVGAYGTEGLETRVAMATHGAAMLEPKHVADYLALPLDVFLSLAYRNALGREADVAGAAHYQRGLLRGRFTRVEVLGRLAFSPEGRRRGVRVPGLAAALALALLYRVPIAGPLAAFAARILKLPAHWQDRSTLEAAALASGAWMKR